MDHYTALVPNSPLVSVDVGGLGNDHGGLGGAAPPRVGVDLVILDGDVVPLSTNHRRVLRAVSANHSSPCPP